MDAKLLKHYKKISNKSYSIRNSPVKYHKKIKNDQATSN